MTKILLVDDEPDILQMVSLRLKANGYEVETAGNGEEGLEKAKANHPDLIVLDVMMPKMDGYQVCRFLKKDTRYKKVPILMLTARAQGEDMSLAEECGADGYAAKPFDPPEFLEKIKTLLDAGTQSQEKVPA
jgi:two-component system, OmpR family, alkaline phosphatase synthesis response regulator PhoP